MVHRTMFLPYRMEIPVMTDTLSRTEYDRLHYLGGAGPATDLDPDTTGRWQHENPDWKARYWRYSLIEEDSELLRPEPINVTSRAKDPR